jgi:hypothetical protein
MRHVEKIKISVRSFCFIHEIINYRSYGFSLGDYKEGIKAPYSIPVYDLKEFYQIPLSVFLSIEQGKMKHYEDQLKKRKL